jgi:hypothetical protein
MAGSGWLSVIGMLAAVDDVFSACSNADPDDA